MTADGLKTLPLNALHQAAGARFGAFAGWSMPLTYPAGVMKEHLHTREQAGLFDISHMKLVELSGSQAGDLLATACPLDPSALADGQSKYTFLLNERAGIIDDLIVTRLSDRRFMVVANAGNAEGDIAHLTALANGLDCSVLPLTRVFLAVQGPKAAEVLAKAGLDISGLRFMHGHEPRRNWFVTRSGYTGEDGFEIGLPLADAVVFVDKLLADGTAMWIGLAARDSLRLEAGLCLHGQDIDADVNPVAAGLTWAIPKTLRSGGRHVGAAALSRLFETGTARRRVGLKADGRQPVRSGANLLDESGRRIGTVTSGGFGPSAGHPVAMGYVETGFAGKRLFAEVRGNQLPAEIVPLPFVPHRYHKG